MNFVKTKIITLTIAVFIVSTTTKIMSQCFENVNSIYNSSNYYTTNILNKEDKNFIDFFNVDIELWQINNEDRFCFVKKTNKNLPRLVLGEKSLAKIKSFNINKTSVYSNLLAYYFFEKSNNELSTSEIKSLPHLLAGYYFCYNNITKNWNSIENDVNLIISKSNELNGFLDNYVTFFENYKEENSDKSYNSDNIKFAFLRGTYFAMPPNYRMHVDCEKIIGNDVMLLFEEANKSNNSKKIILESDLIFKIIKTKK